MPASRPVTAFDTNIFIYSLDTLRDESTGSPVDRLEVQAANAKVRKAMGIVSQPSIISVQLLNEFANIGIRKLRMPVNTITYLVDGLKLIHRVAHLDADKTELALQIHASVGSSFYDSLMLAVALAEGCSIFYSEDMQHDRLILNRLRIVNPFAV